MNWAKLSCRRVRVLSTLLLLLSSWGIASAREPATTNTASDTVARNSPTALPQLTGQSPPFSSRAVGTPLHPTYRILSAPNARMNVFSIVDDAGVPVLKVLSHNAAGTVALSIDVNPNETPLLNWRWKISHALEGADFDQKAADDHPARVYVFFDVPIETLSFSDRAKIRLARAFVSSDVPSTALCYVWDNKHAVGHRGGSPFSDRVHKVVLRSGNAEAAMWRAETRNLAADYRAAFGLSALAPVPRITGLAVGSDTDQTRESVTAWFGDLWFSDK